MNRILIVCLGNICRSPTGEAVMRQMAALKGINLDIDSAGTGAYHVGHTPDKRSVFAGEQRGYCFKGIYARQVEESDFENFNLILAADSANLADLNKICPDRYQNRLHLFLEPLHHHTDVPDPYYGGHDGFELVLDLIEQASEAWLNHMMRSESH